MITLCIRPGSLGNVNQNLNDKLSRTERTFITVSKASQYTSYSQLCNILHTVNSAIYFVQSTLQYTSYSQLCNILRTVNSAIYFVHSYSQLCNILRTVNSAIYFVQSTLHFTEVDLNMSVCKFCASYANARLLFTHTLDLTVNWTFHVMMLCQSKEDVCTKTF